MDVKTFDISVNSAVFSAADNTKCAEFKNVVARFMVVYGNIYAVERRTS